MLLKPGEVEEITGYAYPAYQIRWLRQNRWAFEVGGDGRPKVLRSYAESRMSGQSQDKPKQKPELKLP